MLGYGFRPYGYGPYGYDNSSGTDLSIPSPVAALLRDTKPKRTYLLLARPYDYITEAPIDIKISSDGFASQPDDTLPDEALTSYPNAKFRAGLIIPYNARNSVMSNGTLSDNPIPSRVDIVVENSTGRFRPLLQLEWDTAFLQILLGRPTYRLSQFSPIFTGVSAPITNSTVDEIHIPCTDNSYKLRKPLISDKYRGMVAALRGDGSTGYAHTSSLSSPAGAMSMEMWVRPLSSTSTQKNLSGWRNGSSAGGRVLQFTTTGNNRFQARVRDDTGAQYSATSVISVSVYRMYHVHMSLDTVAQTLTLTINAGKPDQEIIVTTVFNAFLTQLSNFTLMRLPDSSSNFSDVDIDEIRIWDRAQSLQQIISNRDRQITPTTPHLVAYYRVDEGLGSTLFDSTAGAINLTISGTTTWVGTLEGGSDIAGQTPPCWEGLRRQVQPVTVDAQNYVYELSRNPDGIVGVSDVEDKGAPTLTYDTTLADIYAWTPVAGKYALAYMDGRTLMRLEAAPVGALTATITGTGALDTASIIKRYAKVYGGFADSDIDLAAFALATLHYPNSIGNGQRSPDSRAIWDVMQECARLSGGWVTMTRQGLLTIKILERPTVPKFSFTVRDVQTSSVALIARTQAAKQTILGYRPYQTVRPNASDLSTSLSQDQISDLGQAFRYSQTPIDTNLLAIRPSALDLNQNTLYDTEQVANIEATRRQTLWGVDNGTWSIPLVKGLFQYEIGDEILIDLLSIDGTYIENLHNWLLVIVGYTEDPKLGTIIIEGWGQIPVLVEGIGVDSGEGMGDDDGELLG